MGGNYPKQFIRNRVGDVKDLKELWAHNTKAYGDQTFFTYRKEKEECNISYTRMSEIINQIGTAFFKLGVMGKNTAILSETRYEWLSSYLATANGNGVVVPLDKELDPEQILNFLERGSVTCVVYSGDYAKLIEDYAKSADRPAKTATHFVNFDLTPEQAELPEYKDFNIYSFEGLLKMGGDAINEGCTDYISAEIDRDKPCAYLFTSGTTGTSKAVMLSHRNIATNAMNAACCCAFGFNITMVMVLPMHHSYETTCTFLASSMLGSHLCQNESIKMVMRNFQHYKPGMLALVPLFVDTMVKRIWDGIEAKGKTKAVKTMIKVSNALRKVGIDLRRKLFKPIIENFGGNLTAIVAGGAPLNPEHIKTMDAFGIAVWQGYGITECSPLVAITPGDMYMKKSKSCGHPVFQNDVKIIDKDAEGNGEIVVKGENVMLGYLNDEEATKEVFTEDGYFKTGDIGYLDADGYLYINGRKKNLIILSNGKNIYPEEIEEYLYKIEGVKECAVIERKKPGGEDNITALIFPDLEKFEGKEFKEVEAAIKESVYNINKSLPVFKQVTDVEVREVEFEKTTTRKIMRHKLK